MTIVQLLNQRFIRMAFLVPVIVIGFALSLFGSGRADEPEPVDNAETDPEAFEVPFQMLPTNHMVVEVNMNGEGPFRLIFDVGAPITLISNRAARKADLFDGDSPLPFLFGARGEAEIATMQVDELTAEDVPVIIMDHPVVNALGKILGKPIDGLVGHTFFARYKTTIDYQDETMVFEPVDHEIRDFMTELPERLYGPKTARRVILEPKALFGLRLKDTPEDANDGVTIEAVMPKSPAEQAGLQAGDVLIELDGRWTTSVADAYDAASAVEPGQPVQAVLIRDGQEQTVKMTPKPGI